MRNYTTLQHLEMKLTRFLVFPIMHFDFIVSVITYFILCFTDEPPEPDVADIELVAEQNNNVTIRCNHQHNSTVYQVNLERMPHGQPWSIIGVCKKVEGKLLSEDYTERGTVSCVSSLDASLHLTDVEQEDGGFYRCRFSTDAGEKTTTVQLTVSTPGTKIKLTSCCSLHTCIQLLHKVFKSLHSFHTK